MNLLTYKVDHFPFLLRISRGSFEPNCYIFKFRFRFSSRWGTLCGKAIAANDASSRQFRLSPRTIKTPDPERAIL